MNSYFQQIAPRCGGQSETFEELCCLLAYRSVPDDVPFVRLHGAGGDGGIECFADFADGRVGWQAKYVTDIGSLLSQAKNSLTTALTIHPTLTRYVICFPFNLTGPTGRRGKSGQEKFDEWRKMQEKEAAAGGRSLTVEAWPEARLLALILEHDASGGIREFFFNQTILTHEWFSEHLDLAKKSAGPRYTPELNVKTDLWRWIAAFGRTNEWSTEFEKKISMCRKAHDKLASAVCRVNSDSMSPAWPEELRETSLFLIEDLATFLDDSSCLVTTDDPSKHKGYVVRSNDLLSSLVLIELKLAEGLEARYGEGTADSPGFRQFMVEHVASSPAVNLDRTRKAIIAFRDFHKWFCSPACSLAYKRAFVLSGVAGSGKTHGVCDAAKRRFDEGFLTLVTFGHDFGGEPDPWTRLLENLRLPIDMGMNRLLDMLNTAGEAQGSLLILFIDAINETRPLRYWKDQLSAVSLAIQSKPHLRLCVTCRTSFIPYCLGDGHGLQIAEHLGFSGIEHHACQAFFHYYELEPPLAPILQPELSNPLYLKLVCQTLRSLGHHRLPTGWQGLAPTIRAFLEEKEREFSKEHEVSIGAKFVAGSLIAIACTIADSGESTISRSQAQRAISVAKSDAPSLHVLEWLIRADLLIEDVPRGTGSLVEESVVRLAFERLGDFLVAEELLKKCSQTDLRVACLPGGTLHALFKDSEALEQNSGILARLSILVSEQRPGMEFPDLIEEGPIRSKLMRITVRSFSERDPGTFTAASEALVREALGLTDFSFESMDAVMALSCQPSTIDAIWLDRFLKQQPLAKRDAYWCLYLNGRFELHSVVHRLIMAAFELPLNQLEPEIAERWVTILLWFTAAADRRVKDLATRAATSILTAQPSVIQNVLERLIVCDDDEVRERTLLSCYGALIISRDTAVIQLVTSMLQEAYRRDPGAFDNALIRDHIRCISELSHELNVLPQGCDPDLTVYPIDSKWPLEIPSAGQIRKWAKLLRFQPDDLFNDFFKYSLNCLRPWKYAFSKKSMGEWILQRTARDLGYEDAGCDRYDTDLLSKHGGGRSKPKWAERIGKKYQWVAMYQLASRLHDHITRKQNSGEPKPLRTPMILLEERKLDPTLPLTIAERDGLASTRWIPIQADTGSKDILSDEQWVSRQEDVPALEKLLSVVELDGQNWRLLVSDPSWGQRDEAAGLNDPYRHVWMSIQSYLVQKQDFAVAYARLHRRNFFGGWMPEGATWLYGFAGEYPWATPFNTEPEKWRCLDGCEDDLRAVYQPSWNQIAVEWEYDASLPRNLHMTVPARTFFSTGDLWWDGKDGYRLVNGRSVFRDPSVTEEGPESLLVDTDDLLVRLNKLGFRLIWTLLGQKCIFGGSLNRAAPYRTFSQVAYLGEDGSVHNGDLVFFVKDDQDTGPLPHKRV